MTFLIGMFVMACGCFVGGLFVGLLVSGGHSNG